MVANSSFIEKKRLISEECIQRNWPVNMVMSGQDYQLFPLRLIYLEDRLSLIGELWDQKGLAVYQLEKIEQLRPLHSSLMAGETWQHAYTKLEVDNFIRAHWALNNSEIRPVLKIFQSDVENLLPPYLFYLDSYVTINGDNNYIWGLSVERSLGLFSWLSNIGDKIEIMNPGQLKWDVDRFRRLLAAWKPKIIK